jgi:ketosteroid isomerase-like protein
VLGLENDRVQALLRGDTATRDRIYSEVSQDFRSGSLKCESFTLGEVRVRVYENVAVVTGLSTQQARDGGQDISGQFYFTRVYVKRRGQWQIAANHQTRVLPH